MTFLALDVCPHCNSKNVQNDETRIESEPNDNPNKPDDIVCVDVLCGDCNKKWTVTYEPFSFNTYDDGPNKDDFNSESKKIVKLDEGGFTHKPVGQWKHATTDDSRSHGEPVGIDLFDDEAPNSVSIYQRFGDGTRFPARTVSLENSDVAMTVLGAWMLKGIVMDYRTTPAPKA